MSSTIIFNLYINELPNFLESKGHKGIFITDKIPEMLCMMYADDVVICAETAVELQRQLNSISDFCECYGMSINQSKTEITVFRNSGGLRSYEKWYYRGYPVNVTSEYKYMGLLFSSNLTWTKAHAKLSVQAKKSILAINRFQKTFGNLNVDEYFKLFDSMVKPILVYGSEIWGNVPTCPVEKIQA